MKSVSVTQCDSYHIDSLYKNIKKALDQLGGMEKLIQKNMKVALKPNLLMPMQSGSAAITHPNFIIAIGKVIKEYGAKPIIVESPGGPYNPSVLKVLYQKCGLTELAKRYNIPLNYDTSTVEVTYQYKKFSILKPLFDADLIINIPKMKTHGMMVFTGAVKNMFGAIPGTQKAVYHINCIDYHRFANELIDIFEVLKPELTIMDAIIAMEGKGPSAGSPKKVGLILASQSAYALDSLAHDVIQIDQSKSFVMIEAKKRQLDTAYELLGGSLENIRVLDFDVPYVRKGVRFTKIKKLDQWLSNARNEIIVIKKKCIGCQVCKNNCPAKAITMKNGLPFINVEKCILCYCCHELCPKQAIDIKEKLIVRLLTKKRK